MSTHCHFRVAKRGFSRIRSAWLAYLSLSLNFVFPCVAAETADEYQIKAALSYNIARYISWPTKNVGNIKFCIVGNNNVLNGFKGFEEKQINSRSIDVLLLDKFTNASSCQIIFISKGSRDLLPRINVAIGNNPVLTIGEMPGFIGSGGIVNLLPKDGKIILYINQGAAKKSGLKISSKLLRLAEIVE